MTVQDSPAGGWLGLAEAAPAAEVEVPDRLPPAADGALSGVTVLVTGGGNGIGRDIAAELAGAGAVVAVLDLDAAAAAATAAECGAAASYGVDITDPEAVSAALQDLVGRVGRVDVVVNNAGTVHVDPLLDLPLDTWRRVMRVNLEGTFVVAQAAARLMVVQAPHPQLQRRGLLLQVSSGAARIGRPLLAAYGASKAAVDHLSTSLAAALADQQVAAVTVYPGNVKEGMWGRLGPMIAAASGRTATEVESERDFQPAGEFATVVRDLLAVPGPLLSGRTVDWHGRVLPPR